MKRFSRGTVVQSVLFDKAKWTVAAAKAWLTKHGHKTPAADTTADYHRFRQAPPFQFKKGTFRTIPLGKGTGIKAVIAVPRGETKKNPESKTSRIPSMVADLATALSLELEDGTELKFPIAGNFAMCSNPMGDEIWIISRKGAHKVAAEDEKTEKVFEKFTGFEADDYGRLVQIPDVVLKRIGRLKAIIYRSDKFSNQENDYIHAFKQYPTVSVDDKNRPKIVAIRGGRIRVTAEGITG